MRGGDLREAESQVSARLFDGLQRTPGSLGSFQAQISWWLTGISALMVLHFSLPSHGYGAGSASSMPLAARFAALTGLMVCGYLAARLLQSAATRSPAAAHYARTIILLTGLAAAGRLTWSWIHGPDPWMPVWIFASGFTACAARTALTMPMRTWLTLQSHMQAEESIDIQRNFISLLSHNLNTPIAKLAGTIKILSGLATGDEAFQAPVQRCNRQIQKMLYYSRSTLQATALYNRDHKIIQAVSLLRIVESMEEAVKLLVSFTGARASVTLTEASEELLHFPIYFDPRQLGQLASGLVYCLESATGIDTWDIELDLGLQEAGNGDEPSGGSADQSLLTFRFSSLPPTGAEALSGLVPRLLSEAPSDDFLIELVREHAGEMLKLYQGGLEAAEGRLTLKLRSLSP